MDKFSVRLPLTGEYLTTVRLTTGGLCSLAGFDVDFAEDYKVCVTESLLILKRNGYQTAVMEFTVGEKLACAITGDTQGEKTGDTLEDDISRALLSALLDGVEFIKDNDGNVQKITFEG